VSRKRPAGENPYKRWPNRYPGISYRERAGGARTYYVANGSRHLRADGGEQEALLVQADLKMKKARGLRVTPLPIPFRQVAEAWFERGCVRWERSRISREHWRLNLAVGRPSSDVPNGESQRENADRAS